MEFPKRKQIRLIEYDYSQNGFYSITICAENRKNIFAYVDKNQELEIAVATLYDIGKVAEKHLLCLESRYDFLKIVSYCIMPNHIHFLASILNDKENKNAFPRIIGSYKSLVTKECREKYGTTKLFQRSYYDHIIRNEKDLLQCINYIENNPGQWIYDRYYGEI